MARRKYDKDALLADYHTGIYNQRELADRHKVSKTTVQKLTAGLNKKAVGLVTKKLEVIQETKLLSDQEKTAVDNAVTFKANLMRDIEHFSNKFMLKVGGVLDNADTAYELKTLVEGVDKLSVMTKINSRHALPSQMQQNTQNNSNKTITRVFHVVE